jgi:hypothetical protein
MDPIPAEKQESSRRVYRFIDAFSKRYGRKPQPEDAVGDFAVQVARDLQMHVGGARYYLRWATEREEKRS